MVNFIYIRNFSSTYRTLIISSIIWSYLFHTIRTKDMTTIQHNSWDIFFIILIIFYGPLYVIMLMFILLIILYVFLYGLLYGLFYVFFWIIFIIIFFWIIFLYIILLIIFYGPLYGPLYIILLIIFYWLLLNVVKIAHTNRAHICVLSIVYFCG